MKNLTVVSDYNFLAKGLTLYESLTKFDDAFTMHYLCIDKETLSKLQEINLPNVVAYDLEDLLKVDPVLAALKEEDYRYFCWSLASYFTYFIYLQHKCDLTYIDSDIYFHENFNIVFNSIGETDIGLFRHRQYPVSQPNGNGWFNVGVVHFKDTKVASEHLHWWANAVLYKRFPALATCGDQRYLDVFTVLPREHLFVDGEIGHGAPWHWQLYDLSTYDQDKRITWEGKKQKLVFSHFSQFEYDLEKDTYTPCTTHECFTPFDMYESVPNLKKIYDDYFEQIKKTHEAYKL